MRILIIEDDLEAAEAMARGLSEAGYDCTHAADGAAGLAEAQKRGFDVLIVDRMMPKMNGVEVVSTLRREGDATPVLFLSALGEVADRVDGLQAGADDYLVKPYAFPELIARVEALSRRRETGAVATTLKVGELEMNLIARTVHRGATEIDLQPREFQLLEFMMRHAGQSVT
ncbi:MAG: response regulator transcription factor, partial [Caulobacter sp.]